MNIPQNLWPNFENFPSPSFPQEIPPIDVEPDADMLCVRYNPAWATVLASACNQLTQLSSWQGTPDEKKLAVNRALTLKILLQTFEDCDMGCCNENSTLTRITADGTVQTSTDGGTTWVDNPAADVRNWTTQLPPLTGDDGTDKKCVAANCMVETMKQAKEQTDLSYDAGETVAQIIAAIIFLLIALGTLGTGAAVAPFMIGIAAALIGIDKATFDAAFTDTFWERTLCDLYCSMGDNGEFTSAQWSDAQTRISNRADSLAKTYVLNIVKALGAIGLSNAGKTSLGGELDCTGCNCDNPCDNMDAFNASLPGTLGTETARTDAYIEIAADYYAGGLAYFAQIDSGADNTVCCNLHDWVIVTEGVVPNVYMEECGSGAGVAAVKDTSVHLTWAQDVAPFTIRFFMTGS